MDTLSGINIYTYIPIYNKMFLYLKPFDIGFGWWMDNANDFSLISLLGMNECLLLFNFGLICKEIWSFLLWNILYKSNVKWYWWFNDLRIVISATVIYLNLFRMCCSFYLKYTLWCAPNCKLKLFVDDHEKTSVCFQ